jgi:hypothetical protein
MEACKIRGTTQPLVSRTGAGRQENIFPFQSREKNVLDSSSYRSRCFARWGILRQDRMPRRISPRACCGAQVFTTGAGAASNWRLSLVLI